MKSKEWLRKEIHILRERDAIDGWTHSRLLSIINQLPDEREHLENAYEDMLKRQEFEFDGKEHVVVTKPEIPQFVADIIEHSKENDWVSEGDVKKHGFDIEKINKYIESNKKNYYLALAIGYTVKGEPKYYALIKGHDNPKIETTPWNDKIKWECTTEGKLSVTLGTPLKYTAFTIEEWNELGINDTNADFKRVDSHDE